MLHTHEVGGSSPPSPTTSLASPTGCDTRTSRFAVFSIVRRRGTVVSSSGELLRSTVLVAAVVAVVAMFVAGCGFWERGSSGLTLEHAAGQMLMVGFRGTELDAESVAMFRDVRPGGVVLYDRDGPSGGELERNIASPDQLQSLTSAIQNACDIPCFIAIDAEGGYVNRFKSKYGFTVSVPSAEEMGEGSLDDTSVIAAALATEMQRMGVNWNFAPVVDVNVNPESPAIGAIERSFSEDPGQVAAHAGAFIESHRERQIVTSLKHFPGHGSAASDTHLGITDVTSSYRRDTELAPYVELIDDGYNAPIMTAHIVNRNLDSSAVPATLSRPIMTDLIRGELGFEGVIISDDMQMGAIVEQYGLEEAAIEAIEAGVDIVMIANQQAEYDIQHVYRVRDAIVAAVRDGILSRERVYESVARIESLKRAYGIWE